jgi:uncharacterized protein (DUF4415 family)
MTKKIEKTNCNEAVLEVTQAEYNEVIKLGWNDDDIQKPGKHIYRRTKRIAKPEDLLSPNIKVDVTFQVSLDVLEYFQKRAEASKSESYQAEMFDVLLAEMERDSTSGSKFEHLTENTAFIQAVAERVKNYIN